MRRIDEAGAKGGRFETLPEVETSVRAQSVSTHFALGDVDSSLRHAERVLPDGHRERFRSRVFLGEALQQQGKLAEACWRGRVSEAVPPKAW